MPTWEIVPREVPIVAPRYRTIVTPVPAAGPVPILDAQRNHEPASMGGPPPVVWDRADGFQVTDRCGNRWPSSIFKVLGRSFEGATESWMPRFSLSHSSDPR